ncbi:hypothetical protein EK21DRAFT_52086 [Setomelanomma holmii]|uniref:DUF6536 domain-containing protein n=1 Tax=Setomelanomma holmii TaxID=210430 RepID=A0A9P4HP42_9PLEO|nr:hypothetical protein EK21DRAFT_52086 [Setomelanomma holmii]
MFYDTFICGWRAGLIRSFLLSLIALIVNVSVYSWLFSAFSAEAGTASIMRSSCGRVRGANTGIHAALNILSTLILGASTYAMQGMTAPTRQEVDKAHGQGKWVEIGTQSARNLFYVRRRNAWIWLILGLTSLPFHLFFNARVVANEASFDVRDNSTIIDLLQDVTNSSNLTDYVRMDAWECMQNYSSGFLREYGDVVAVSTQLDAKPPILYTRFPQSYISSDREHTNQDPYHWICHDFLTTNSTTQNNDAVRCSIELAQERFDSGRNWTLYGNTVSYCLARRIPDICELQFNQWLMLGVVVFGGIKTIVIAYLLIARPSHSLRTLGDAITSFLKDEDPTTKDMCLVSSKQIRKHGFVTKYEPQIFTGSRPRWLTSANTTEFFSTIGISAFYIVVLSIALFFAVQGANGFAFSSGLGVPDIQSLASFKPDDTGSSGIVPTLLIVNIPQLGFSILYVVYTSIWGKLLIAHEFDRLTQAKKGLRISERPRGMQRASHFFTMPSRYALPLMGCSAALHWLCSQSFFMVRIDGVNSRGEIDQDDRLVRLGYSSSGILALIGVALAMLVATVCIGSFRRLWTSLGETSMSAVISAACHPGRYEVEPWLQEVQWGDVTESDNSGDGQTARHISFTARLTERPTVDQAYT